MFLTRPGKSWLSQELRGHCAQPGEKWEKVKKETYGWHAPAVRGLHHWAVKCGEFQTEGTWRMTFPGRSLAHMGLWVDKEGSVWQNGSHVNDQFITVCQGREKGKDGKKEKVSQQAFKETDFLPAEERNADIFLLAAHRRFWLVMRGYRWVSKPCFDWTEGMWRGQCGVQSMSGLGWRFEGEWKTLQWRMGRKKGAEREKNEMD